MLVRGDRAGAIELFERGLAAGQQAGHGGLPAAFRCSAGRSHWLTAMLGEAAGLLEKAGIPDGGAWVFGYEAYLSAGTGVAGAR